MLRSYKVSIVVGTGIPLLAYFSWVAYFSHFPALLDTVTPVQALTEEMSIRADKAAIAIERADGQLKRLTPQPQLKTSKLAHLWE